MKNLSQSSRKHKIRRAHRPICLQTLIFSGRHDWIWTNDLYRVRVALSPWATCLNLNSPCAVYSAGRIQIWISPPYDAVKKRNSTVFVRNPFCQNWSNVRTMTVLSYSHFARSSYQNRYNATPIQSLAQKLPKITISSKWWTPWYSRLSVLKWWGCTPHITL